MSTPKSLLWFSLVAATTWALMMTWEASEFKKVNCSIENTQSRTACKYTSPIAALELATDPQTFRDRIDQDDPKTNELWNTEIARVNTCMDFLFIALYWGVFLFLGRLQSKWFFILVIVFISLAAIFDIVENIRLFQALRGVGSHQLQFPVPGYVSKLKWYFFASAILTLSIAFLRTKRLWAVVMSILMLVSGLLTFIGVSNPPFLFPAVTALFIVFLIALFYYFPYRPVNSERLFVWIEFAYLIRFQLISAVLLAVVLPASYFLYSSIFVGLFDVLPQLEL